MQPFSRAELHDFNDMAAREWLSPNGIGGFASGTISGAPTRRYHALLVAPVADRRMTLLSDVDETLSLRGEHFNLSVSRYADGTLYPDGYKYIESFTPWPVPTWVYKMELATPQARGVEVFLVKRIFLARDKNTVYVTYTLRDGVATAQMNTGAATLRIAPLVTWKDYHAEMHPWPGFPAEQGALLGGWQIRATPDAPPLRLLLRGGGWTQAGWWNENIAHDRERERGQDFEEDVYCPALVTLNLRPGETATFVATIEEDEPQDATLALAEIVNRQKTLAAQAGHAAQDDLGRDLVLGADLFVARIGVEKRATILAGYPWFMDWGRDTHIALPGVCLATGRISIAREILEDTAKSVQNGLIPNRFPDRGNKPDYNTADATLWFVRNLDLYFQATKDEQFRHRMVPILLQIIEAHQAGTLFGIRQDTADGLLHCGEPGSNLSWMDAKIGDWVVTPRVGKPVEINALWINALRVARDWIGEEAYGQITNDAARAFKKTFVRPDGLGLYDVIHDDGTPDPAIRPNQIIAVSLSHMPQTNNPWAFALSDDDARRTLDVVRDHLLTPFGLRTLATTDPAYRGHYKGDMVQRDSAYHQGTVWPWLLGAYVDACRRVEGDAFDARRLLAPLEAHLRDYGVAGIAEVFDGNAPHAPNGSPWQAWSLAEVLRVRG